MITFNLNNRCKSRIKHTDVFDGENIEKKIARIVLNNEPIIDGAPLFYCNDSHEVNADYDPRTDTFEVAVLAMDHANRARYVQKRGIVDKKVDKKDDSKDDSKAVDSSLSNNATE